MNRSFLPTCLALILGIGILFSGCALTHPMVDSTKFYVLNSQTVPGERAFPGTVKIALKHVDVPAYLRGRSIVIRSGENEVQYIDSARWAEPLDLALARVIKESLTIRPDIDQVLVPPFLSEAPRDFDLVVHVINCEGAIGKHGGGINFKVSIELYRGGANGKLLSQITFTAPAANWDGRDYGQLSSRLSEAVGQLCAQIPIAIGDLIKTVPPRQ